MELEFRLARCTTVHFKGIIKSEVVIFLSFRKKKESKGITVKISKNFERAVVLLSKVCRSKISELWRIGTLEIHYKKGWFFHKIFGNSHLKFGKTKKVKIRNHHFHNPLIANQNFLKTELIIGKSDLAHIIHFQ